ncbi:MAG: SDR family NAD(P)-dependent oxidoreductase, partial [Poseidonia sp.]
MPVAVVTGANRGLGFEMVRQLLQREYTVHATYRTSPGLLSTLGDGVLHQHQVDVRDGQAIAEMMDRIGGSIDLLINNAGIADGRWSSVEAIDFDVAAEVLEVNAVAPVRVTQAALPLLAEGGGTVVMITSLMGSIGDCMSGKSYAYRASKTALNMFTVAMKNELQERGVSVLLIHPGWV